MKKIVLGILSVIFASYLIAQEGAKKHQFIGVDKCKTCHKTEKQGKQVAIWEASKHAQAFATLKSEESIKIAKEKGIAKAPHEAPECLKCHASGYDLVGDTTLVGPKFAVEHGVQCETCHGAGGDYKTKKIMESREESIKNGMKAILVADGTAEKQCRTCHNEESPTFKGFNFEEQWKKIAHPVPAG
ncbi:MAG: cytochrome C554 [Calditrichaceae bacterium]|nr:cytochrome c family protein [Calditrichia bacterium]NUQ42844.1 cytochrome C554 [Calditrichaceae bacterium]